MKTFKNVASIVRIGFPHWSLAKKRYNLKRILNIYAELHEPYETIETCFV